jgi:hypothetical protein
MGTEVSKSAYQDENVKRGTLVILNVITNKKKKKKGEQGVKGSLTPLFVKV